MKVAIIGAGGMAEYHYKGFTQAGAEVVAIVDMVKAKAEKFALEHNIKHIYSTLSELLEHMDVDGVSIVTPNKYHAPLIKEALLHKKHVFCEKPPAINAEEMIAVAELAKETGKILMFDFNNRARPESEILKKEIDNNRLGDINSAEAEWIRRTGIPGIGGWFTNKEISGGGPVLDLVHMLDLSLYFMGYKEPEWVLASTFDDFMGNPDYKGPWGIPDVKGGVTNVESASHAFIRFSDGSCLYSRASWAEMIEREVAGVTLQGKKAGARLERLFGVDGIDETAIDSLKLFVNEDHVQKTIEVEFEKDEAMGRIRMASNFIEAVEGKTEPKSKPDEAIKLMKIVDALYESASSGKPVQIKKEK